ncbi:MAG: diacylglycerol kinase family protein [Anaerolineales bacterium]
MSGIVILNPYSNRWKAEKRVPEIIDSLEQLSLDCEVVMSQKPEHAIDIAEQASREGRDPIIAAGGDGTIGEVINGLYRANPEGVLGPLGIIPLGTANDLVVNLGLPLDIVASLQAALGGKTRRIDLGQVNDWVFDNNSAVGLEPVVTIYNIRMTRLQGVLRYLVAALRAIAAKPEYEMRIRWDDGEFEGLVSLVSVGNCPLTGGMFKMAPDADPTDGLLTFVYGYAPTHWKMLSLLPRTISGGYIHDPAIHQHHTRQLEITCSPGTPIQADGEIRAENATTINYRALPARLDLYTP